MGNAFIRKKPFSLFGGNWYEKLMYTENELKQKLTEYRHMPSETEWLEFKEAKANYSFDELGKYFSALSNEANLKGKHSGWLVFGIRDKAPREIVGTLYRHNRKDLESLKHEIARETGGITFQEIYELHFPEGRVILFQIPAALVGIPTSWKGHFFGRDGESLVPLSIQELEAIRAQVASADWSAGICPDAGIAELDDEALRVAKAKFQKKHTRTRFAEEIDTWDTPTFLEKAKLTRNGKLTRTAILLLGKSEAAHHLIPFLIQK
jgi:ATP-dependent DNA helicase RecG